MVETSFWVLGHRADVLPYLFRFFDVFVPEAVRSEILAPDPRHTQRVYGYQEMYRLLERQDAVTRKNPKRSFPGFHVGEAAALALALEEGWWLLINEQRALRFARQQSVKAVTVPELIVYLYEIRILSVRSAHLKLRGIASNTGQQVMQAAWQALATLARDRGEEGTP